MDNFFEPSPDTLGETASPLDRLCERGETRDWLAATMLGGLIYSAGFGVNNVMQPYLQNALGVFYEAHGLQSAIGPNAEAAFSNVWNAPYEAFVRNYIIVDVATKLNGVDIQYAALIRAVAGLIAAFERGYNSHRNLLDRRKEVEIDAEDGKRRFKQPPGGKHCSAMSKALWFCTLVRSLVISLFSPKSWASAAVLVPSAATTYLALASNDSVKSLGLTCVSDILLIVGFRYRLEIEYVFEFVSGGRWSHAWAVKVGGAIQRGVWNTFRKLAIGWTG
ncbi:hypothetical protein R3P38DRAFT_2809885 [Favolaschia claudopus]|uniref:Uncharacterized protein n=1 Tax=Favolaschia claudopus TaxID=2862362 RepID=A0AAV9Z999_9AGAR